nr:ribonuclease H-like domain-containing protein [Tanacetum cinerariifolium]
MEIWFKEMSRSTGFTTSKASITISSQLVSFVMRIWRLLSGSQHVLLETIRATPTQAWLWHQRLSHLNFDYINLLLKKDIVIGLPKLKCVEDQLCSSCELSKAKRSSFKSKAVPSSKGKLNLLHMDLCSPMRVASINGKKYILVIVDDYTRYTWTLFLRSKDETPEVLKDFLTMIQRNIQAPLIIVRSNPSTNVQSTSAPSTHTNVHAEENNNDQAEEGKQLQDAEFTNHFYAPAQEEAESSSHNIGNLNVPTFNQPHVFEYRWMKDHPLEQVRGNPSRPMQTRRQLATDPEMCMFALTVSTTEPKNIKEVMADSAWIEAMQEELYQFDRLQVWELVDKPFGKPIIRLKWLWKNKKDEDQTVIRNKATQVFSNFSDGRENGISQWSTKGGGHQIHQSPSGRFINQAKYTLEILHKHGMDKGQIIWECQKPKRAKDAAYHREKMLLCKQEESGIQLHAEQADWKDDTDDESDDQELEAHYMYMAKIQEVSLDAVDSRPIFDTEPEQKVQNDDHYDVFAIECQHPEQSESVHKTYLIEHDAHNVIIESVDMNYNSKQIDQNDEDADLAKEHELLAFLIKKLKCEINESKNRNKFLETSNKVLIDKLKSKIKDFKNKKHKKSQAELKRRDGIEFASEMELECAKMESQ